MYKLIGTKGDPARGKRSPVVEINGFTLFHCKRKKTEDKSIFLDGFVFLC